MLSVLKKSLALSIIFGSSIVTLGTILTWVLNLYDLTPYELALTPIGGAICGYIGWKVNKITNPRQND